MTMQQLEDQTCKFCDCCLLEQLAPYKQFLEHTPAAVAMLDRDMRYVLATKRWLTDQQLLHNDIIGKSHYEVFPDIGDRWKQIYQRCLAEASCACEDEAVETTDGTTGWVKWEVCPWYNSAGEVG